jgi:integrase
MPKLTAREPKVGFHKTSGQARVKYLGKVRYLGKFGSKEAKAAYHQFLADFHAGKLDANLPTPGSGNLPGASTRLPDPAPHERIKVKEVILRYYQWAERRYVRADGTSTGEANVVRACLRPVGERYGELPADELSPLKLVALQEELIERGWSRKYINRAICMVGRCYRWAKKMELVTADAEIRVRGIEGVRPGFMGVKDYDEIEPVSDEDVDRVLDELSPVWGDAVRIARLTGMRPGEVVRINAVEIDRSDPTCWMFSPRFHKTAHRGKKRHIAIGPKAIAILAPRLLQAGRGPVFPVRRDSFRRAIARACARAFPHPTLSAISRHKLTTAQRAELNAWNESHRWTPNQLRHARATELEREFDYDTSRSTLGHTSLDTTAVYVQRDLTRAMDAARKSG